MSILLIGMAGVGKSTVGKLISEKTGLKFIDIDLEIEKVRGKKIIDIINELGEEEFGKIEEMIGDEIDYENCVVSPGGSIIYRTGLMDKLSERCTIIYLRDTFENIESRIDDLETRGIIGTINKSLRQVYEERLPLYEKYAHVTIDCQGKNPSGIANEILEKLKV